MSTGVVWSSASRFESRLLVFLQSVPIEQDFQIGLDQLPVRAGCGAGREIAQHRHLDAERLRDGRRHAPAVLLVADDQRRAAGAEDGSGLGELWLRA